ncbi:DUF2484 family protein [Pontibaca salina]|uniref:DUF2484 family protein n=1 Tax=Pontibaca salina TaxID=2795731 RepID=A0A934HKK1_9RHOB|nr:DUF2484 family protein [Pontibaca salina]MBI6629884.1 DUF2484 family protein [Pontibaca salina]
MTLSLFLAALWAVMANILAVLSDREIYWKRAYVLIGLGVPLIGFVTFQNGPWVGMMVLAAGVSVLRWPVIYLAHWVKAQWQDQNRAEEVTRTEGSSP